jgi:hypothetical protein
MIYSIPYVLLIFSFGALSLYIQNHIDDDRIKNSVNYLCAFILIIFFGFRGFICDDWIVYYVDFQKCSFADVISYSVSEVKDVKLEPGFSFLMCICKSLVNDYRFFVLVCTTINTMLLFRFIKDRVENIPFTIVLYLCFGGFGMNTNMMRNSIAILIFLNSLKYIEQRKIVPYFIAMLLALSFHLSSLMYFPMYFLLYRNYNKWIYLSVFILGNVIFILHFHIFTPIASFLIGDSENKINLMVQNYTSGNLDVSTTLSIGYLERLLTGILIFCYYDKLKIIRSENVIFINSFTVYFMLFFYLSEFQTVSIRMSNLFIFSYWILWGDLLKCFSIENNKKLFLVFLSIYCILKIIGMTNMKTSEYDNVLFGAKSYEERLYLHNKYATE